MDASQLSITITMELHKSFDNGETWEQVPLVPESLCGGARYKIISKLDNGKVFAELPLDELMKGL